MDPLNQLNAMYFQESLTSALDLSMGCEQNPVKTDCVKALDLVKKPIRSKRISGIRNKNMDLPEPGSEGHISQPFPQVSLEEPQSDPNPNVKYLSKSCSVVLHNHNPLAWLRSDTDQTTRTKEDTKRGRSEQNGLHLQSLGFKKYATQALPPKTGSKGSFGHQDDAASSPLHSVSPVSTVSEDSEMVEKFLTHSTVESMSSGSVSSRVNSPYSVESISSFDSEVIEVPVTSLPRKQYVNGHLLSGNLTAKHKRPETETLSTLSHQFEPIDGSDCSTPIKHRRCSGLNKQDFPKYAETLESVEESYPILLQDSDQETEPSTSDAEKADVLKSPQNDQGRSPKPTLAKDVLRKAPPSKKQSNTGRKRKRQAKQTKPSPGKKATSNAAKRRKKKSQKSGPSSSLFSACEPEIKLKYARYKEEKKEGKGDHFVPYIRMNLSACTIVNFQEDVEQVRAKKCQRPSSSSVPSGVMPTSSKLQLGRVKTDAGSQADQQCCLCGRMANVAGLGDLHGPYFPCQPHLDSRNRLAIEGAPVGRSLIESPAKTHELLDSPSKLMRKHYSPDECPTAAEGDSDEGRERWVHEDCSVWSAGVFLVKGKLYGLEEAIRLARVTVCSCCNSTGATLGCFFKGCPNKYHFPCAVQAECALNEENFTIRCLRHKYPDQASADCKTDDNQEALDEHGG